MNLEEIRKKIDSIDESILKLLAERLNLSRDIGWYKKENNLQIRDEKRESELVKDRYEKFRELGFDDEKFVKELFNLMMEKSRQVQFLK